MGGRYLSPRDFIANALVEVKFTNVFTFSCNSSECAEPIVVGRCGFVRDVRMRGEERGTVTVPVYVVRDADADAESIAFAAEAAIKRCAWEGCRLDGVYRACGLDTSAPVFKERDSSGRFVWSFEVFIKVVRVA